MRNLDVSACDCGTGLAHAYSPSPIVGMLSCRPCVTRPDVYQRVHQLGAGQEEARCVASLYYSLTCVVVPLCRTAARGASVSHSCTVLSGKCIVITGVQGAICGAGKACAGPEFAFRRRWQIKLRSHRLARGSLGGQGEASSARQKRAALQHTAAACSCSRCLLSRNARILQAPPLRFFLPNGQVDCIETLCGDAGEEAKAIGMPNLSC